MKAKLFKIYSPSTRPMSIAVFLSGKGTNLKALIEKQKKDGSSRAKIDIVFTNVPNCLGAKLAEKEGIEVISLSSKSYFKYIKASPSSEKYRIYYDAAVLSLLDQVSSPDIIVLAGYKRRLSSIFFERFENRIINMYPGDITKQYLQKGKPAYLQALEKGEKEIRCSVYIQKEKERFGPLISLSDPISLEKINSSDEELVAKKIREEGEWLVLPYVIYDLIALGRVSVDSNNFVYIDDKPVNPQKNLIIKSK